MKNLLTYSILLASAALLLFSCGNKEATQVDPPTSKVEKTKPEEKPAKATGYQIGDKVEDFSLENIDGKQVSLASLGDVKGATIVFTCNTCPYAVMYEDRLVELSKKATAAGYPIVAIMPNDLSVKPDDSLEKMKERSQEKSFDFPYIIDAKQEIYPKFGATKTPEVFVLQKKEDAFHLVYKGAIDDNHEDASAVQVKYVEDAFSKLGEGKDIDPNSTKAIGCSIKVKKG